MGISFSPSSFGITSTCLNILLSAWPCALVLKHRDEVDVVSSQGEVDRKALKQATLHLMLCQCMELLVMLFLSMELEMMPSLPFREVFLEFPEKITPSMLKFLRPALTVLTRLTVATMLILKLNAKPSTSVQLTVREDLPSTVSSAPTEPSSTRTT